jgi:hypothetical protein
MAQEGLQGLFGEEARGVGGPVVGTCSEIKDLEFGVLWIGVSKVEGIPGLGFAGDLLVASVLVSGVLVVRVSVRMHRVAVLMGVPAVRQSASRTPSTLELVAIATGVLECCAHRVGEPRTKEPGKTSLGGVALAIAMLGGEVQNIVVFVMGISWVRVLVAETL